MVGIVYYFYASFPHVPQILHSALPNIVSGFSWWWNVFCESERIWNMYAINSKFKYQALLSFRIFGACVTYYRYFINWKRLKYFFFLWRMALNCGWCEVFINARPNLIECSLFINKYAENVCLVQYIHWNHWVVFFFFLNFKFKKTKLKYINRIMAVLYICLKFNYFFNDWKLICVELKHKTEYRTLINFMYILYTSPRAIEHFRFVETKNKSFYKRT